MALSSLQLEAFYCLAQIGNFTRAAARLGVTQSALSQRIINLESELETALFIRERTGVQLTGPGLELLRYCQAKESLESEFLAKVRSTSPQELAGLVRVAGFSSVMQSIVVPALAPLMKENPGIRLIAATRELRELWDLLKKSEVDFIVLDRSLDRQGVVAQLLGKECNVLVEKEGYRGPDVYLDHDENDETTSAYFKRQRKKLSAHSRHYLDDIYGILNGVELGLGRAIVPRHLLGRASRVRIVAPETTLDFPVVLHYFEQPYYSRLHQAVVKALVSRCPGLLRQ